MAFGKSPEQKAAEEQQKVTAREAADEERTRQQFLTSPVGQATVAKQQGQGFFEVQLEVGSSQRDSTFLGGNNFNLARGSSKSHAGTLAAIEAVGWHLEHVGHVFIVTSESSRDKFMSSGQQTAVSGITMGIYLFRNVDHPGQTV